MALVVLTGLNPAVTAMTKMRVRFGQLLASTAPLLIGPASADAAEVEIAAELARLAEDQGFEVVGGQYLEDALGWVEGDDTYGRVRMLLDRFDHIILQRGGGGIERVIILGKADPSAATPRTQVRVDDGTDGGDGDDEPAADGGEIVLETIRTGNQHSVRVALESSSGERIERTLLIDTGADSVVLPVSMIAKLGISGDRLDRREVQTANGKVQAQIGSLPGLWLGTQRVSVVAVAFIDDAKLGNTGLLGMSVLGRYQMTIDDEKGSLTLTRR